MRKKNNKLKIIAVVFMSLVVIGAATVMVAYRIYLNKIRPASDVDEQVGFTVEEGDGMSDIIDDLYETGLIQDKTMTKVYVKLNKVNDYYAGNYLLNRNMSNKEIFEVLSDMNNCIQDEVDIKIPDGAWARDVAKLIAEKTNLEAETIMREWNDVDFISQMIERYDCLSEDILASEHCYLEGYLVPNTYRFFEKTTVKQVTMKFLDEAEAIYDKYKEDFEKSELTTHEIFTLASIIQFESGNEDDNKIVSSVFHNRIADDYLLQSSVTVCYAMYNYASGDECELDKNLNINSRYNTYKYAGLPIGPICNGNEAAIDAAIHPADTDYYYFIGANGKTYFASTLQQHYWNVDHYLN